MITPVDRFAPRQKKLTAPQPSRGCLVFCWGGGGGAPPPPPPPPQKKRAAKAGSRLLIHLTLNKLFILVQGSTIIKKNDRLFWFFCKIDCDLCYYNSCYRCPDTVKTIQNNKNIIVCYCRYFIYHWCGRMPLNDNL
ncbi:hypothetical protein J2795_002952 [Chryseobacterium bernardetii]|uniref:Uncharacterized protein n=1 Tax=Chryseobacterium bernardetii TaxID=1241978 RepID=A0ACC6IXB3_9FLAO|nr:hypothetical protein [Chryseobacterium bernardetii]